MLWIYIAFRTDHLTLDNHLVSSSLVNSISAALSTPSHPYVSVVEAWGFASFWVSASVAVLLFKDSNALAICTCPHPVLPRPSLLTRYSALFIYFLKVIESKYCFPYILGCGHPLVVAQSARGYTINGKCPLMSPAALIGQLLLSGGGTSFLTPLTMMNFFF